ncbi:MAG: TRAP transporter small permease [Rhodobacteraceae bacterium]|nr:TRAP transporter small permease [Paracoccaceae bacterium]
MSSSSQSSGIGRYTDKLEETVIALILGAMTMITFVNVVLRFASKQETGRVWLDYLGLPGGLQWGLEATSILFAWLVLFGMAYCVKITAHLGVDSVTNLFSARGRRKLALVATALSIVYAMLLLKGGYDYYANFANLPATTGHWFPTGFEEMKPTSYRSWYEMDRIKMFEWLRFIEPMINEGEAYNKIPRFLPYTILPIGTALLLFRLVQAFMQLARGTRETLIVSHEAEDDVKEVAAKAAREE